jgi:uncharacterized protein YdeI (YjbR/CyaY-like superfamily)
MAKDPRVDAYIARAAPFAQPILEHCRALIHRGLPEAEETIKWGMPHFTVGGKNVAGIAAFKAHCAFIIQGEGRQGAQDGGGMGGYGKIASLADLPGDNELIATLADARQRIGSGAIVPKPARKQAAPKPELAMQDDFAAALKGAPAAQAGFDGLAPGYRREYLEWVLSAKRAETREKRIAKAVEQIAEGKKLNWKYDNC